MGLFIRKSVRLGPVRFNLAKSGTLPRALLPPGARDEQEQRIRLRSPRARDRASRVPSWRRFAIGGPARGRAFKRAGPDARGTGPHA